MTSDEIIELHALRNRFKEAHERGDADAMAAVLTNDRWSELTMRSCYVDAKAKLDKGASLTLVLATSLAFHEKALALLAVSEVRRSQLEKRIAELEARTAQATTRSAAVSRIR